MKRDKIKSITQKVMFTTLTTAMLTMPLAECKVAFASDNSSTVSTASATSNSNSHNFTTNGTDSDLFNIEGTLSTKKGSATYKGLTLTQCLKMNRSAEITFKTTTDTKLTLVFNSDFNKKVKIDGTKEEVKDGIVTIDLKAGEHTIEKANTANLYYIELSGGSSSPSIITEDNSSTGNNTSSNNSSSNTTDTGISVGNLKATGTYTNLLNIEDSKFTSAIYVSPNGSSSNDGSSNKPLDLTTALKKVSNGEKTTILLQSGTYKYNSQINIDSSGNKDAYNVLKAAKGANVVFDFSGQSYNSSDTSKNDRGIQLNGNYWYVGGITIKGAADNGMLLAGSYNTIERCILMEIEIQDYK